jgi:peptide chain release factor
MIKPRKWDELKERMAFLKIVESDIKEQFIGGSGGGGQKVNKTSSCVRLTHLPSGLQVKCQQARSREDNRFFARRMLCDQWEQKERGDDTVDAEQLKIRRQKKRRSRRSRSGGK